MKYLFYALLLFIGVAIGIDLCEAFPGKPHHDTGWYLDDIGIKCCYAVLGYVFYQIYEDRKKTSKT